jgi:2-polyprenyl-6-hydroxyphenyl methylase/3-demethylubiquinone-9 3-methyltransferase
MNVSAEELMKFERLGAMWRDPRGPMRVLHVMNPLRTRWIAEVGQKHFRVGSLARMRILDVGCGAGLLSESLAALGADVTGIDPVERNIRLARAAAEKSGQTIDYRPITPEAVRDDGCRYAVVCALEVIEHVPDRPAFLRTLAELVEPGGLLFVTTIDRSALSWLVAIFAGETVLRLLPKGTHRWEWFARPSEVQRALESVGMRRIDLRGMWYAPFLHRAGWTGNTCVNWAGAWRKA